MPLPPIIQHPELLREKIEALQDRSITVRLSGRGPVPSSPLIPFPDDPTFYDKLWREHLKAAYERDEARRTP